MKECSTRTRTSTATSSSFLMTTESTSSSVASSDSTSAFPFVSWKSSSLGIFSVELEDLDPVSEEAAGVAVSSGMAIAVSCGSTWDKSAGERNRRQD